MPTVCYAWGDLGGGISQGLPSGTTVWGVADVDTGHLAPGLVL